MLCMVLSHPDLCRDDRPTGVKVQSVETRATCRLWVEEGGSTAKRVEQQLNRIQLRI